ncbi:purine-nucleoside phosphorylase, partial [Alistipes sp. OttesenSCG-928-B03]|nr:purine-nucleoside phosphorylase [Alistipes sp. OttesenSCG-928-B03]
MLEQIRATASYICERTGDFRPEAGIILGSGLGGLVEKIEVAHALDYSEIPGFPVSTVEGHRGRLIFGTLGGRRVVAMQGRFHYYEGYTPQQVVFPVRVMKQLGIGHLFVSNAAGGINPLFHVGDLMVITDHINLIPNPLVGPNIAELGPRFPDMSDAYDPELVRMAGQIAAREGITLRYGCYVGGTGPTFETRKEYGYFQAIGGDAVGMSTTPEVIAARHMGVPVFGVSVITN